MLKLIRWIAESLVYFKVFNIFLCEKRHFLSQENVRPGYVSHLGNFRTFLIGVWARHLIFLKLIHTKLDYIGYLWVPPWYLAKLVFLR